MSNLLLHLFGGPFQQACAAEPEEPGRLLAALKGSWSFVLLDSATGYVLAARSPCGCSPLYWGVDG